MSTVQFLWKDTVHSLLNSSTRYSATNRTLYGEGYIIYDSTVITGY